MADLDTRLEQPALNALYRASTWWMKAAACFSAAGAAVVAFFPERRASAIVLMMMGLGCQLTSWVAMRGAWRLEKKRLARIDREGGLNG